MRILMTMLVAVLGIGTVCAGFNYESEMTVQGYSGSETLSGFPVLVRLESGIPQGFNYDLCQSDGKDIAFYASDRTTVYPHEIETWDPDGESLVWVRLPSLSGSNTKFYFRFGDSTVTADASTSATWANASTGHYAAVWHFADTTATGSEVATDSAKHDASVILDLTPKGSTATALSTTGVVGKGRVNTATESGVYYETSLSSDFTPIDLAPNFTVTGWFRVNQSISKRNRVMGRSTQGYDGDSSWAVDINSGGDTMTVYSEWAHRQSCTVDPWSNMTWQHIAIVFTSEGTHCYTNGVLSKTLSDVVAANNSKNLRFGYPNGSVSDPTSYFGDYDELRLLNIPASADWIRAECDTAANKNFIDMGAVRSLAGDSFAVTSAGAEVGTVSPAYGAYTGTLEEGTEIACTATADLSPVSDTLRCGIDGWKLYERDSDNDWVQYSQSETGRSLTYTHSAGKRRKLEWQLVNYRPLVLSATRTATYLINGAAAQSGTNWVEEGVVTVDVIASTGTAGRDFTFVGWEGDTSSVIGDVGSTNIVIGVTGAVSLNAAYSSLHFVSTASGSDETGDGSREHPWATINNAITNSATFDRDEIHVAGGTYQELVENKVRSRLTVRGGYREDWTRDIRNSPTVICQADPGHWASRKNNVTIGKYVVSNCWDGLTITGGATGLSIADYCGHRFDRLIITNNITGISFEYCNWYSAACGDTVIASCYISHNGHTGSLGYGNPNHGINIMDSASFMATCHILNCTIVSNGTCGVFSGRNPMYVVNSIITDNGWSESRALPADFRYGSYNNKVTKMRHTDIWNRTSERGLFLIGGAPCGTSSIDLGYYKVYGPRQLLNIDPRLETDGSLAADSPLVGMGEDLSEADIAVTTDVYGEAFRAGAYDIGCFKSSVAKAQPAKAADVYVATDGDNANAGTSADAPLRSVGVAMTRVAENGTVHVAAGVYDETAVIDVAGVTLEGAGRDATVFRASCATNTFGLYIGAPEVTVRKLAVENALFGIQISDQTTATNALVENCRLAGNRFGYFHFNEGTTLPGYPGLTESVFRLSRLVVTNNSCGAGYFGNMQAPVVIDNSLFAFNGGRYVGPYGGPYATGTKDHYYNCTFVSNANFAVWSDNGGNSSRDTKFYNCVFAGSPIGWKDNGHFGWGCDLIFDCETNYVWGSWSYWQSNRTNRIHEVTAPLDWSERKWARPIPGSLAAKGGVNHYEAGATLVDARCDLDGETRTWTDKWFIGCYSRHTFGLSILVR